MRVPYAGPQEPVQCAVVVGVNEKEQDGHQTVQVRMIVPHSFVQEEDVPVTHHEPEATPPV